MYAKEFKPDLYQHVQLRTILDSLEIGALRFHLHVTSQEEQQEKFNYLKTQLTPIIKKIWAREEGTGCPDGYYECDGVCQPYPCQH